MHIHRTWERGCKIKMGVSFIGTNIKEKGLRVPISVVMKVSQQWGIAASNACVE